MPDIKSLDELKAAYPDFANQLAQQAAAAALDAERQRIKDIDDVAIAGYEDIVEAAKYEKPMTAAEVAMAIINRQKEQGADYLKGRAKDVDDSKVNDVGADHQEGAGDGTKDPYGEAIDRLFPQAK